MTTYIVNWQTREITINRNQTARTWSFSEHNRRAVWQVLYSLSAKGYAPQPHELGWLYQKGANV